MIQLIYASAATKPFSPEDLRTLLAKARRRNSTFGVSGMLLYHSGSFLQVLEGPQAGVDLVLKSIEKDPRHNRTKILLRQEIDKREFGDWSMGFVDSAASASKPDGMVDYHRTLPGISEASTRARQFLRFFQSGLHRQGI